MAISFKEFKNREPSVDSGGLSFKAFKEKPRAPKPEPISFGQFARDKGIDLSQFVKEPEPRKLTAGDIAKSITVDPVKRFVQSFKGLSAGEIASQLPFAAKEAIPKVRTGTINAIKTLAQGIARSGGSVGLTLTGARGEERTLEIDPDSPQIEQDIQRAIFGDEPVRAIEDVIAEGELKIRDVGKFLEEETTVEGGGFLQEQALPISFLGTAAFIGLDFTGAGGQVKALTTLSKLNKIDDVAKVLKKLKVADDLIPQAAKVISKTDDIADITRIVENLRPEAGVAGRKVLEEFGVKPKVAKATLETARGKKILTEKLILNKKFADMRRASTKAKAAGKKELLNIQKAKKEEKAFLKAVQEDVLKGLKNEKSKVRKQIGFQRKVKNLDARTMSVLKEDAGIKEWNNANKEQLEQVLAETKKLQVGDKFLTERQVSGLDDYLRGYDKPKMVTQREATERFGETDEVLDGFITKRVSNLGFPTVDVKQGHKVVTKIVDRADTELRVANKRIKNVNQGLEDMLRKAEKGRKKAEVGENIFKKMSGADVPLTAEEDEVVKYLKNYFEQARKDLGLERYRRNYITNLDKTFLERLQSNKWKLVDTIKTYQNKQGEIPTDVMNALDNIIGSEKFFRFALVRTGGIDPTTNIRRILREYSGILENKKAIDKVLPEGQAAVQLLLQPKTAEWMKKWLQNIKGRGLDSAFRNGKMGWAANLGDKIIDFGYIRLLGGNYWSALKNIVGGEANSLVFQSFGKYLKGKKRILSNPRKAYRMIADSGLLDGSYVDVVKQNIISKGKRGTNLALYGGMEAAEYEIRGSYFLGELTDAEWAAKTLSPERFRKILDDIAITQGVYSKIDSPLFAQTVLGRSVIQFGRWKITNANLVRRIGKAAKAEWKAGNLTGENTQKLLKMFAIYSAGTYLAYEAGKAGWDRAQKVAQSSTELLNVFLNIPEEVMTAISENPALQTLDAMAYTTQQLTSYMGLTEPPRKIKFRSGVEDTYFSGLNQLGTDDDMDLDFDVEPDFDLDLDLDNIDIDL